MLLACWLVLGTSVHARAQGDDCMLGAAVAVREQRWVDASRLYQQALDRPACADSTELILWGLAFSLRQIVDNPEQGVCAAVVVYGRLIEDHPKSDLASRALEEALETRSECDCASVRQLTAALDAAFSEELARSARQALLDERCPERALPLQIELARAIERQAEDDPERACDAYEAYAEAERMPREGEFVLTARLEAGLERTRALCVGPSPEPVPSSNMPAPQGDSTTVAAWSTTGAAVLSILAGAAMLNASLQFHQQRQAAVGDYREAHAARDPAAFDAARARFEEANSLAGGLHIGGWAAVVGGLALAGVSTWLWSETSTIGVEIEPTAVGLRVRF